MLRSMFSAISGLRNHQTSMDVIANNLANINTTGFKGSRVSFQDILNQTVRGASAAVDGRGGMNPIQIGLGTVLASVGTTQTQGNLQSTGKFTDLAIQGDGFFIMGDIQNRYYTRDGSVDVSLEGDLVHPSSGLKLLGWTTLDSSGAIDTTQPLAAINIPIGQGMIGQATSTVIFDGNLDADATSSSSLDVTFYDSLGGTHQLTVTLTKTDANTWTWTASETETGMSISGTATGTLTFNESDGSLATPTTNPSLDFTFTGGAADQTITLDISALTQLAADSEITSRGNGAPPGTLTTFTIGASGDVTGVYSNGINKLLGRVAVATFGNPGGLLKMGANMYQASPSSGDAQVGSPGSGRRGLISTGFLEMSNVDLSAEFTNMIMAERGFQANARVITTSDSILQDLVNLRR